MEFEKAKKYITERLERELSEKLFYHSVFHTKDVCDSAAYIAHCEGLSEYETGLLLTACLYHDSGFVLQQAGHEQVSCSIAREHLPGFGYTGAEIEKICGIIMATRIPQTPHNLAEEIICDADLDYLGRDDFFVISHRLFLELKASGVVKTEEEWDKLQIVFLEKHNYFTQTSVNLRKAKKDEHIAFLKSKDNNSYHEN